jgi:hypothetical protein
MSAQKAAKEEWYHSQMRGTHAACACASHAPTLGRPAPHSHVRSPSVSGCAQVYRRSHMHTRTHSDRSALARLCVQSCARLSSRPSESMRRMPRHAQRRALCVARTLRPSCAPTMLSGDSAGPTPYTLPPACAACALTGLDGLPHFVHRNRSGCAARAPHRAQCRGPKR